MEDDCQDLAGGGLVTDSGVSDCFKTPSLPPPDVVEEGRRTVYFVEANPFRSRLHVLGPMVQGASAAGCHVEIRARRRVVDDHLTEWVARLPVGTTFRQSSARNPMEGPGNSTVGAVLRLVLPVARRAKRGDALVLTAVDDYPIAALLVAPLLGALSMIGVRIFIVRYRVQSCLVPGNTRLAHSLYLRTLLLLARATLVTFDERLQARERTAVLPDPWDGAFGGVAREDARRALGIDAGVSIVGLIGYQDERKGFPVAAEAIARAARAAPAIGCLILGRIAPGCSSDYKRLAAELGDRLWHEERFVSDAELPLYFSASDVILLPYADSFNATSGVLARAAASGVPVIASPGGLVGFRVSRFGLGTVTADRSPDRLEAAIGAALAGVFEGFDEATARQWAREAESSHFADIARIIYG